MLRRMPPVEVQQIAVQMILDRFIDEWTGDEYCALAGTLCQVSPDLLVMCLVDAVMDMFGVPMSCDAVEDMILDAYEIDGGVR